MKLLKHILLVLVLLQLATIAPAQQSVFIEGYVTALETGVAVPQHEVTIGTDNMTSPLIVYTGNNGYYSAQLLLSPVDTASAVFIFVTDCNQQQLLQLFAPDSLAQIRADFQICTLNSGCLASFTYRQDSTNQQLVYFENLSSPVSYSTDWFWDFGDGQISNAFETSHEYNAPGIYSVCLMMTDSALNCTSQFCMEVWIDSHSGECEAFYTWVGQGLTVAFTDISTGFPDTYFWDFGDGTASSEPNPLHTWLQPGTYPVCLSIYNNSTQCGSTLCNMIVVGDTLPGCQAFYSYANIQDQAVAFTNLSTGEPDQVVWDFGDGTVSNDYNPVHSWLIPGIYQVCLSIFNSTTQCENTFCDFVTVGDTLPGCQSYYIYQPGEGNTLAFTNLSTGMIDQFIWDFGDGTTSGEANPVHTWQQTGIYHVCLAVISNYFGCSDVYCSDITLVDSITVCHAGFTIQVDSIPGNINHYWFTDTSIGDNITNWFWDFGDGSISFLPSLEYTFAQSGTYTVRHAISGVGNGGYCADTTELTITTPAYSNLGGQVFAGNFPINNPANTGDTALVRLYRKSGNFLSQVASGFFYEYGYYFFLDVPEGNYVVHAGLTPGSAAFSLFLPSYTGETRHWQQSQHISLDGSDVFDADVLMPPLALAGSGPGIISGNINCIDNSIADLQDRLIFLQQAGNIIAFTQTGDNGEFLFSRLPLATYMLSAEIAGMYSQPVEVNLTETENQALLLQVEISASGVFGTGDFPETAFSDLRFYPNPASENISLAFDLAEPAKLVSVVYASSGIACYQAEHNCTKGENKISIRVNSLSSGIYLLALQSPEGQVLKTIKFTKR